LDVLTLIPEDEILTKGIAYVESVVGSSPKWDLFWKYFKKTWIQTFPPRSWNIRALPESLVEDLNRTNNPLERYNRKLNDEFRGSGHPPLLSFIEGIRRHSTEYIQLIRDVQQNRVKVSHNVEHRKIPQEYKKFGNKSS
jgi:hypothetical protein